MKVVFYRDVDDDTGVCPQCGGLYENCPCPGPTTEGYEYEQRGSQLWARPIAPATQPSGRDEYCMT